MVNSPQSLEFYKQQQHHLLYVKQEENSKFLKKKLKFYKVCKKDKVENQPGGARLGRGSYFSLWNLEYGPCFVSEAVVEKNVGTSTTATTATTDTTGDVAKGNSPSVKAKSAGNTSMVSIELQDVENIKYDDKEVKNSKNIPKDEKLIPPDDNIEDNPTQLDLARDLLNQVQTAKATIHTVFPDMTTYLENDHRIDIGIDIVEASKKKSINNHDNLAVGDSNSNQVVDGEQKDVVAENTSTDVKKKIKYITPDKSDMSHPYQLTENQLDKREEVLKLKQIFASITKIIILYEETLKTRISLSTTAPHSGGSNSSSHQVAMYPTMFLQLETAFVFIMCCLPNILLTLTVSVNTLRANEKQ
jgi:hypothetical protein